MWQKYVFSVVRHWPRSLGGVRLRLGFWETLAQKPFEFVCDTRYGFRFSGNTRDVIQRAIWVYGVWEPDISCWVADFLRRGDVVVDVGANAGYFSLLCASQADCTVIAAEPLESMFRGRLAANLSLNAALQIQAVQTALGASEGTTCMYRGPDFNLGHSATVQHPGMVLEGATIVTTGDDLLASFAGLGIGPPRLIKIDTEGDEVEVLRGFSATIAKMSSGSAILVEVSPELLTRRRQFAADVWAILPPERWDAYRILNDYNFARYERGERLMPMESLGGVPRGRVDAVFVRR